MKEVSVERVSTRGPGGHFNEYKAFFVEEPDGPYGYGATAKEATQSLLKAEAEAARIPPPITGQYGWFVWTRKNGQLHYHKYIIEGDRVHADTKKYYEGFELKKFPLTKEEWKLPFEELAAKFPLPKEFM